jgi:hypothetical protein
MQASTRSKNSRDCPLSYRRTRGLVTRMKDSGSPTSLCLWEIRNLLSLQYRRLLVYFLLLRQGSLWRKEACSTWTQSVHSFLFCCWGKTPWQKHLKKGVLFGFTVSRYTVHPGDKCTRSTSHTESAAWKREWAGSDVKTCLQWLTCSIQQGFISQRFYKLKDFTEHNGSWQSPAVTHCLPYLPHTLFLRGWGWHSLKSDSPAPHPVPSFFYSAVAVWQFGGEWCVCEGEASVPSFSNEAGSSGQPWVPAFL